MITLFYGVIMACPIGERASDCPFRNYKDKIRHQGIDVLKKWSFDDQLALYSHHKMCLHRRENNRRLEAYPAHGCACV
jgi:hypothetical protein